LNPHALAGTSPSSWRVCLFRHSDVATGEPVRGGDDSRAPNRVDIDDSGTNEGPGWWVVGDIEAVRELYGLAPGAFVAARDALAKQLRAEGDAAGAAAVKGLRRPTVAAWAVNQVARDQPVVVAAVLDAGAALGAAQREVVASGDRALLRAATTTLRQATAAAVRAAVAHAGEAHRDAIAATFDAAATDPEAGAQVQAGQLSETLQPTSGFGALGELPAAAPAIGARTDEVSRRRLEQAEARAVAARDDVALAEEAVAAAHAQLERACRAAAEAAAEVERLRP
jgi:hypothetical protein